MGLIDYPNIEQLIAQAKAIQYLPPGTFLSTDQAEDEKLLRDLIGRDSNLDPVRWLSQERADLCVKILFWQCLKRLRVSLVGLKQAISTMPQTIILHESESNIGYRLNDHDVELLKPLAYSHPIQVKREILLDVFWQLKRDLVPLAESSFPHPDLLLRNQMLSLPPEVDPLLWLKETHIEFAAASALQYLLDQILPPARLSALNNIPTIKAIPDFSPVLCRAQGIDFEISLVMPIFDMMCIEIAFTVMKEQTLGFESKAELNSAWIGVPSLLDELGHHYLVSGYVGKMEGVFPMNWKLRFAVYPQLVKSAKAFTLSFKDVSIFLEEWEISLSQPQDEVRNCYEIPLKDLSWKVDMITVREGLFRI